MPNRVLTSTKQPTKYVAVLRYVKFLNLFTYSMDGN